MSVSNFQKRPPSLISLTPTKMRPVVPSSSYNINKISLPHQICSNKRMNSPHNYMKYKIIRISPINFLETIADKYSSFLLSRTSWQIQTSHFNNQSSDQDSFYDPSPLSLQSECLIYTLQKCLILCIRMRFCCIISILCINLINYNFNVTSSESQHIYQN